MPARNSSSVGSQFLPSPSSFLMALADTLFTKDSQPLLSRDSLEHVQEGALDMVAVVGNLIIDDEHLLAAESFGKP